MWLLALEEGGVVRMVVDVGVGLVYEEVEEAKEE